MSVRKRARFLSPDRISEMVFDSESEEARASSDCIIYIGNGIVCIFRRPLKYLWFSYSFLDKIRKYDVETIASSLRKIYWKLWCKCNSTQQNLVSLSSWQRHSWNVACELRVVWRKKLLVKFWEIMVCVWHEMVFLTLPGKSLTPKIFTLKFPVHTSGPKQKRK